MITYVSVAGTGQFELGSAQSITGIKLVLLEKVQKAGQMYLASMIRTSNYSSENPLQFCMLAAVDISFQQS